MSKWNPGAADITKDDHEIDFAFSITSKFILSCFCHLNNILKNVEKNRKQNREKLSIIHKATLPTGNPNNIKINARFGGIFVYFFFSDVIRGGYKAATAAAAV